MRGMGRRAEGMDIGREEMSGGRLLWGKGWIKARERAAGLGIKGYLWELLVLLCVAGTLCFFAARKEGYHMDELLSFELSNAEFNPWIVSTQPVGRLAKFVREEIRGESFQETWFNLVSTMRDVAYHRGESRLLQYKADVYPEPIWISAQQFKEYITVDERDSFNYLSVYFNVKDDPHPPLYYLLLHTVSSLFRGKVEPVMGCAINILAILGCCLCFLRLGRLLEAQGILPVGYGRILGLGACLVYGLSQGAVAATLLIRMYGLLSFWCVAFFVMHVTRWLGEGFCGKNKILGTVAVLGFLTQYFFLLYCFALAAVTAVLLWRGRRYRELKAYVCSMAAAAAVGLALWPFAVKDVFLGDRGVEALGSLGEGLSGYSLRLQAFGGILMERCLGGRAVFPVLFCLAAILAAAGILWWRGRRKITAGEVLSGEKTAEGGEARRDARRVLLLMLLLPAVCYFLLAARLSPFLVGRYIMPLFPFGAMGIMLLLGGAFSVFQVRKRYLALLPAVALGVVSVAFYEGDYLYQGYDRQVETAGLYQDLPCVCLYEDVGYYYNLIEFTRYQETLLSTLSELQCRQEPLAPNGEVCLVVLRKAGVDEKEALEALLVHGYRVEQVLLRAEESVYGDTLYLCVGQ